MIHPARADLEHDIVRPRPGLVDKVLDEAAIMQEVLRESNLPVAA